MRISLVLALCALHAPASANCTPGMQDYERAWPGDGASAVPTDARILVSRFGTDAYRDRVVSYALTPDSGPAIPLRIVEDLRSGSGNMHQRTLVLAPARPLAPTTRYAIALQQMGYATTARFTTGAGPDTTPPSLRGVRARPFVRTEWGCGPGEEIPIEVDASDDTVVWLRLRVAQNETELAAHRYLGEMILPLYEGVARFGHEMCIGNWGLRPGLRFVARSSVLDPSMHEVDAGPLVLDAR